MKKKVAGIYSISKLGKHWKVKRRTDWDKIQTVCPDAYVTLACCGNSFHKNQLNRYFRRPKNNIISLNDIFSDKVVEQFSPECPVCRQPQDGSE